MRSVLMVSFILLAFFLIAPAQVTIGSPAPDFTLNSLDQGPITLSNYLGKVVFIYFVGFS